MKKLLAFDLDGTLCEFNGPMRHEDMDRLCELEREGYKIAVVSGKPVYYLCGYVRQIGLESPILAGENGGNIQFGIQMPHGENYAYPVSDKARAQLNLVKRTLDEKLAGERLWFQPNSCEVTPFVFEDSQLDLIADAIKDLDLSELVVYRHIDCFDFIPNNINKGNGVKFLCELLGITVDDVIAFGDAINDIPMFDVAGTSVMIGGKMDYDADYKFDTIGEALAHVDEM